MNGVLVNKAWGEKDYAKAANSTEVSPDGSMNNVPYSVSNPLVFLYNRGAWTTNDKYNPSEYTGTAPNIHWQDPNVLDDNGKSIFDPCPPGWRLPKDGTWAGFAISNTTWSNAGRFYYPNGNSDQTTGRIYFPASGNRIYSSGSLSGGGSSGTYWSCSPYSAANGYNLYFGSSSVYPSDSNNRARGFPVRPVQE